MTFLNILGDVQVLCNFRLGKIGKEIPESTRLEFLKKFFANNFALSDAKDNNTGLLNRGDTEDLPLLTTLLAIHQISRKNKLLKTKEMSED